MESKIDKFNNAEVSFADYMWGEEEIRAEYLKACIGDDGLFIDTAGMKAEDAGAVCSIAYLRDREKMTENLDEMTETQNSMPEKLKASISKWKTDTKARREKEKELYDY